MNIKTFHYLFFFEPVEFDFDPVPNFEMVDVYLVEEVLIILLFLFKIENLTFREWRTRRQFSIFVQSRRIGNLLLSSCCAVQDSKISLLLLNWRLRTVMQLKTWINVGRLSNELMNGLFSLYISYIPNYFRTLFITQNFIFFLFSTDEHRLNLLSLFIYLVFKLFIICFLNQFHGSGVQI